MRADTFRHETAMFSRSLSGGRQSHDLSGTWVAGACGLCPVVGGLSEGPAGGGSVGGGW